MNRSRKLKAKKPKAAAMNPQHCPHFTEDQGESSTSTLTATTLAVIPHRPATAYQRIRHRPRRDWLHARKPSAKPQTPRRRDGSHTKPQSHQGSTLERRRTVNLSCGMGKIHPQPHIDELASPRRDWLHARKPSAKPQTPRRRDGSITKIQSHQGSVSALKPQSLPPQGSALNPQPSALNPQPSTLSPQPSTLNPPPSPRANPRALGPGNHLDIGATPENADAV